MGGKSVKEQKRLVLHSYEPFHDSIGFTIFLSLALSSSFSELDLAYF